MNKIEAVMKLYKSVFPHTHLERRGVWISVDPCNGYTLPSSFYPNELLDQIFDETGKDYGWDAENKELFLYDNVDDTKDDDQWNTSEGWNNNPDFILTKDDEVEEEDFGLFDDIGDI